MTDGFFKEGFAEAQMRDAVRLFVLAFNEKLEEMCEKALQDGFRGVLITWTSPTAFTMELSNNVPYGSILEIRGYDLHG